MISHARLSLIPATCALIVFSNCGLPVQAQSKGVVFTQAPDSEPNYPLMGEFTGPIQTGDAAAEILAIQIRPVGNDSFEAIQFTGGLPGQEGHQGEPARLIGRRSGEFIVLSGGPYAVLVEPEGGLVIDRKGNRIGELARVHRASPTLGAPPPSGATVLFDGTSTDQFAKAEMNGDGWLLQGATVKPMLNDFDLHLEFYLPYMPQAGGQSRGNSGIYLQSRYECQILDSFADVPTFNGCGALYRFRAPDLNMCLPPLVWQTYDIRFTAPRWAADRTRLRGARVTSWVNGVKVHDDIELAGPTGHGKPEEPNLLPTLLQDHGDPVRFRNVWVIDRGLMAGTFPVFLTPDQRKAMKDQQQAEQAKLAREAKRQEEAERERAEQEAIEKARKEVEQAEQAEQMKAAQEKAEREKAEREKAENIKAAKEKADRQEAERQMAEQEKAKTEKAAKERAEREEVGSEKVEDENR